MAVPWLIFTTLDVSPMPRRPTIAARARIASTFARRRHFPRPISSTRGAAFPISRSSTRGTSQLNFAIQLATASMAATIASRCAHGTSLPLTREKPHFTRAQNL